MFFLVGCGSSSGGASGPTEPTGTSAPTTTLPIAGFIACPVNSTNETATTLSDCTSSPVITIVLMGPVKRCRSWLFSLGGDNTRTQCPAGSYSTVLNNSACVACGVEPFNHLLVKLHAVHVNLPTHAVSAVYSNGFGLLRTFVIIKA